MTRTRLSFVVLAALLSCGPAEIKVGARSGIPAITGSTTITLDTFVCGEPISSGGETVQTKVVPEGCELTYSRTTPLMQPGDYDNIPEFRGASKIVKRVELTVSRLTFVDGTTGATLDLATRIVSASFSVNGQQLADKSSLSSLPKVIVLEGAALNEVKSAVEARRAASVQVKVVVVIPQTPAPPASLTVDYDAQPAIILGL